MMSQMGPNPNSCHATSTRSKERLACLGGSAGRVLDVLEFGEATPANWASGIAGALPFGGSQSSDPWVFVSPTVSGWVSVVGSWLPYPASIEPQHEIGRKFDLLFSRLMKRFDDVQFFGSYRVVDFVAWARALNSKPLRIFAYADGEVLERVPFRWNRNAL